MKRRDEDLIDRIDSDIQFQKIIQNLNRLKEEYREVVQLRFIEDYSIAEIAKIMNRSRGATRVLLHRALESIKKNIT